MTKSKTKGFSTETEIVDGGVTRIILFGTEIDSWIGGSNKPVRVVKEIVEARDASVALKMLRKIAKQNHGAVI